MTTHDDALVRLLPRSEAPLTSRPSYSSERPGPLVMSFAHVPELVSTAMPFIGATLGPSAIDQRLKQIVILRTSVILQCHYCLVTHALVSLRFLSREEVRALLSADCGPVFADPREAVLLAWTEAMAADRGPLPVALTTSFTEAFDEDEVVELTLLAGATMMLNRYATAMRLPLPEEKLTRFEELRT